ncbi:MAG TPA: GNAT family N-acetyltransferase [Ilumatobacteraceae bacterium]
MDCSAIDVHDALPEMLGAVRELILRGLAEHWGEVDASLNRDVDDLAAGHPGSRTLVACHEGRVVGTGTVVRCGDGCAEIVRMSVDAKWRRSGVGRRLVDDLVEVARSWRSRRVVLETSAHWMEVVAFYERCGFVLTHHREDEFGVDAWFEKRLDDAGEGSGACSGRAIE